MAPRPTPILPYHQEGYPAIDPSRPELSSQGKSVLITGAGSGIGAETAIAFAQSGASHLGLVGRRVANLETTKATISSRFPNVAVHVFAGDVTDLKSITAAVSGFASVTDSGKIDVVVANAGYVNGVSKLDDADPEDWWRVFDVNVRGNFNLLRAFGPVAAANAVVLHVSSSIAHFTYIPGYSAYSASKMAGIRMFEHFAIEHPGIRVIHYHPGLYRTEIGSTTEESGLNLPFDHLSLASGFAVWAASPEAAFLNNRFVWAAWDVDTLKSKAAEIAANPTMFTFVLDGFPY